MREVERQVMLRIIDQRWREHLEEMDYLKEGINLRAMGQKDPLTEWQREGYEMFGAMMKGIAQDFVRYVMHVQVVAAAGTTGRARGHRGVRPGRAGTGDVDRTACPRPRSSTRRHGAGNAVRNLRTSSSDDVGGRRSSAPPPRLRRPSPALVDDHDHQQPVPHASNRPTKQETVVKDEWSKTPRNAPCPCGSGKKFKMCHGAALSADGLDARLHR